MDLSRLPADVWCLLDGRVGPVAEARISPLDRGFLFGDGIYEVVRLVGGRPVLWQGHRRRLEHGLGVARLAVPGGAPAVAGGCRELAAAAGVVDGSLYLQVTRGAGPREKVPPDDLPPTVFAFARSHPHDPPASRLLSAVTRADLRWGRCDVKTVSLMATVLGKLAARDAGADEVLFVGPEGDLREGGSTNLLVVRGGRLQTHPLGPRILPGVTRGALLELAAGLGLGADETAPRLAESGSWEEAMLCGTLTGVQPLVELDGRAVGDGGCGPWTRRLAAAYAAAEPGWRSDW